MNDWINVNTYLDLLHFASNSNRKTWFLLKITTTISDETLFTIRQYICKICSQVQKMEARFLAFLTQSKISSCSESNQTKKTKFCELCDKYRFSRTCFESENIFINLSFGMWVARSFAGSAPLRNLTNESDAQNAPFSTSFLPNTWFRMSSLAQIKTREVFFT